MTVKNISTASPDIKKLFEAAKIARDRSYSPYSKHQVGAALFTATGDLFSGCNIENSSFGATICAERVAIHTAIAALGKTEIRQILVLTDATPAWPPCGLCRQVISEFGENSEIISVNLRGEYRSSPFKVIFPEAFTPAHLSE